MDITQLFNNLSEVNEILFWNVFPIAVLIQVCSIPLVDKIIEWKGKTDKDTVPEKLKVLMVLPVILLVSLMATYAVSAVDRDSFVVYAMLFIMYLTSLIIQLDIRVRIIPNQLLEIMVVVVTVYNFHVGGWKSAGVGLLSMVICCAMACSILSATGLYKVIGAGDVKMISVAAGFGGMYGLQLIALGMGFSMLVVVIPLLLMKVLSTKSMIPFGPFIGLGVLFACTMFV